MSMEESDNVFAMTPLSCASPARHVYLGCCIAALMLPARLLTFRIGYTCGDWRWCEWGMAIVLLRHGVEGMANWENDTPEASIMNLDITVAPPRSHTQVWRHPLDGV